MSRKHQHGLVLCSILSLATSVLPYYGQYLSLSDWTVADFLSSLVWDILPRCSLVFAHDFARVPDAFQRVLANMSGEERFCLKFRVPDQFRAPDHRSLADLWDWYDRMSSPGGDCVVHFLTSDTTSGLRRLSLHHAFSIRAQGHRDFFVVWTRKEPSTRALSLDVARGWTFKLAVQPSGPSSLELYTICFYCNHGDPATTSLGSYPDTAPHERNTLFPDTTLNLNNRKLKIPFHAQITQEGVEDKIREKGFWKLDFVEMAVHQFGLAFNYRWDLYLKDLTAEEIYTSRLHNGTWIGYIRELTSGSADTLVVALFQADSMTHVNLGFPVFYSGFFFVRAHAGPVWSWQTIFWPYSAQVWLCILFGTAIGILSAWLLLRRRSLFDPDWEGPSSPLAYVCQYLLQSFLEQLPNREVPAGDAFRTFLAFWLFLAMVITCGYQEAVFSFVAIPRKEVLPVTFSDLLDMEYEVGAENINGLVYSVFLRDLDLPLHQSIKESMVLYSTYDECITRCAEARAACFGIEAMMRLQLWKHADQDGKIPYFDKSEVAVNMYTGSAYPKDFPSYLAFYRGTQAFLEGGLLAHYMDMESYNNLLQSVRGRPSPAEHRDDKEKDDELLGEDEEEERKPLSRKKLFGPFGLIVSGWVFSMAAFAYEVAVHPGVSRLCRWVKDKYFRYRYMGRQYFGPYLP